MEPQYNHIKHESEIVKRWEAEKRLSPPPGNEMIKSGIKRKPFSIIMPPPNANDPLHVGHALFITIEDILARYHRMLGEAVLWLPGTDHAGIETQYVYEKKLNKEGNSRFSYDRETLYTKLWDYVQENSNTALEQMKRLGASADWSRTTFTLNPKVVDLVLQTFERMHAEGLIYRGYRMVNYCPKCGTGYSELEVVYKEQVDPLYYLKYGPFELATVRPETKFGDTAVAVNPKDKRYAKWVGKAIEVEGLLGRFSLSVIADDYVDPKFGTGVVKITPAHDPNDFAVGQRHNLEIKQVIGFDGKMLEAAGPYAGMIVAEARQQVVADLTQRGLISRTVADYTHNVSTCYRCSSVIEPLPLPQFFVKVKPLTNLALKALDAKETKIHGAGHDKILRHWLIQLEDWNISRQIVWGIRMPVWYDTATPGVNEDLQIGFLDSQNSFVKGKLNDLIKKYQFPEIEKGLQTLVAPKDATYTISRVKPGETFLQDTDTFDTWFSSSQWPVVTLKTSKPGDFDYYYPTSVMETAYDILMFWVMRMMMMGIYLTGQSPFKDVYLHGLVRDDKGQKMSKSKGNVINPLTLVDKYGADAVRMALVMSTTPGHDTAVGEQKVKGMRNLANKIWNATRFVVLSQEVCEKGIMPKVTENKEFSRRLLKVVTDVTKQLSQLKVGLAAETVYNEFWHWYCDQVIEERKKDRISQADIRKGLIVFLKLLHPFAPFVTEAAWSELHGTDSKELLILETWPTI